MPDKFEILAFSGSLRKGSYNQALLNACKMLAPADMTINIFNGIGELPHYVNTGQPETFPPVVEAFRTMLRKADALLIATPEFNYSISGVLKNAIDWGSRRPDIPLERKSIALIGASMGAIGTARAQNHLRQIFVYFDAFVLNRPEVFVTAAHTKFDADGTLKDTETAEILKTMLSAFRERTIALKQAGLAR